MTWIYRLQSRFDMHTNYDFQRPNQIPLFTWTFYWTHLDCINKVMPKKKKLQQKTHQGNRIDYEAIPAAIKPRQTSYEHKAKKETC